MSNSFPCILPISLLLLIKTCALYNTCICARKEWGTEVFHKHFLFMFHFQLLQYSVNFALTYLVNGISWSTMFATAATLSIIAIDSLPYMRMEIALKMQFSFGVDWRTIRFPMDFGMKSQYLTKFFKWLISLCSKNINQYWIEKI